RLRAAGASDADCAARARCRGGAEAARSGGRGVRARHDRLRCLPPGDLPRSRRKRAAVAPSLRPRRERIAAMSGIERVDFIGIPSRDAERSRAFYVEKLGFRPDGKARFEFWAGETCFGIWEPERMGMEFAPQKNRILPSTSTTWRSGAPSS